MNQISILKILKPHGLKGEMKCLPLTDETKVFEGLKSVYLCGKKIDVISSKFRLGYVYIILKNYESIEKAETLRNQELFIDKSEFSLDMDTFFVDELVGLEVYDQEGEYIGDILGVENYGAGDILEVKDKWATYLVPFIKQVFIDVDIKAGKVIVNRDNYKEHRA